MPGSLLYFALVLALGETSRRRLGVPPDVTRKGVLGAFALWGLAAAAQLPHTRGASSAFLGLAGVLYVSFRFELLKSLEDEGPTPGTVLAALSLALLLGLLGEGSPHVAGASALSMLGDGTAALVGRRLGTRKFHILGHARTMEGALTLFLVASAGMAPALRLLGELDWHQAVAFALIAGTVAAAVEAFSPWGSDNATVPISVAVSLILLTGAAS